MYTRITTYHCKPEMLDKAIALVEKMNPEINGINGLKQWFCNGNEDGNCVLIGIYESREAAEAAKDVVRELFGRFVEYIDSEFQTLGYEVLAHGTNL